MNASYSSLVIQLKHEAPSSHVSLFSFLRLHSTVVELEFPSFEYVSIGTTILSWPRRYTSCWVVCGDESC